MLCSVLPASQLFSSSPNSVYTQYSNSLNSSFCGWSSESCCAALSECWPPMTSKSYPRNCGEKYQPMLDTAEVRTVTLVFKGFPVAASRNQCRVEQTINSVCTHIDANSYNDAFSMKHKCNCKNIIAWVSNTQHYLIYVWFWLQKSYKLSVFVIFLEN